MVNLFLTLLLNIISPLFVCVLQFYGEQQTDSKMQATLKSLFRKMLLFYFFPGKYLVYGSQLLSMSYYLKLCFLLTVPIISFM